MCIRDRPPSPSMKLCVSGLREKADIGTDEGFLVTPSCTIFKDICSYSSKGTSTTHTKNFFLQSLMSVLFSVIFSVHGLKYIENKLFLFVPSGKISGACGWVQFPLATVLAGYIARLECRNTISQTLRWKKIHSYHNKKR